MSTAPARVFTRRRFVGAGLLAATGAVFPSASLFAQPNPVSSSPAPSPSRYTAARPLVVGVVLFENFELLDAFGPLEIFGLLGDRVRLVTQAERPEPVRGRGGPRSVIDRTLADAGPLDLLLIPGGQGTRQEVGNVSLLDALKTLAVATPVVATVCTGSALLARTGLLDGLRATTNKRAFKWVVSQGPAVRWVPEARWVEDGKYATSSGISAGIDLSLALVARFFDRETALSLAQAAEYAWHDNPAWDPFAQVHGLVP